MRKLAGVFVILVATTCTDREPTAPPPQGPVAQISDAVHSAGNAHFFFLPPLVPAPTFGGVFDPSLSPVVRICEWTNSTCASLVAEFSSSSGSGSETVRLAAAGEQYIVNWHTDQFNLDPTKTYRIRVLVAGVELGFADVDVVGTGKEMRNVATSDFVPLLNGHTLPIKFRIEHGAFVPCPAPEIAFNQGEPSAGILVVDPAGCRTTLLIDDPNRWEADPAWSPDGQMIAYSGTGGDLGIPVVSADGSTRTLIHTGDLFSFTPAWSPDGGRIAYAGPSGITVVGVDGSNKTLLNPEGYSPAWSPDGNRIAFSSSRNGLPEIYVMEAYGSNQNRLTVSVQGDPSVYDVDPDWSPDGTRIAFTRFTGVSTTIVIMDADGSNAVSAGVGSDPSWSPDGTMIAFSAFNQIHVMNADGSNRTRITENSGFGYSPDWRPAAR